ncbi:kinesin-like protein KIF11 [Anolis carolinensis]|uniref:Kinesin family member 11 n=1 Tax=Anolis carolinensis TaxID=28377 RepID=H9GBQ6_ANOCA|nr:PREDICTED: kinesin-like protein KIF11 [Anolis carolinensis]|eukprot:XP_008113545.1 PREDICTED: kinesin-like protein KIF11 [Anolis carolinensis]
MTSQGGGKKEEKGKNIQVVVRCRPFNTSERKSNSYSVVECEHARKEITVRAGSVNDKTSRKTYTFDMVFGAQAKQIDVYRSVICPILDEVLMGYNCTVFAYGQTGTGKTFTMEGERSPNEEFTWEEDPLAGVIPRTLHQIFEKLAENGTEFSVKVSLLEIYNEELFDLLNQSPDVGEKLQMFDDPRNKRGVIIKGLEEITVHNKDEVYEILERGAAKRKTAATYMNQYSSRSHSVFSVTLHMKETTIDGEELVKIGKLNLVDLAGSENIGRSGAVDKRAREAGNINQSLLTLGRVITALVERAPHIPYRESKLTRILQDSLGGRTKTCIIATISPASINLEETLSTLEYAHRAKNIMNKPEVNQKLTKRALIKEYTEEIERLKKDLIAAREKHGVYISLENYDALHGKLTAQEEQIAEYVDKIAAMEENLKRVTELFTVQKDQMERCQADLQVREKELEDTQKHLEVTKVRLFEEEYVASNLETTEEKLHGTATKLLSTVEETTKDVSGLHAKLDRKKAVEQNNAEAQKTFREHMNALFGEMQNSVKENYCKQRQILDSYAFSVGDLLSTSSSAFGVTAATIDAAFNSVKEMVSSEVSLTSEALLKQESLTSQNRKVLQKVIEEHASGLDRALSSLSPIVKLVLNLNSELQNNLKKHTSLAEKMTCYKEEMAAFFQGHSLALSKLQEDTSRMFSQLQQDYEHLEKQMEITKLAQKKGTAQLIVSLKDQLNLLEQETQLNLNDALEKGGRLKQNIATTQDNITVQTTGLATSTSSQHSILTLPLDDFSQEIRQSSSENIKILLQSTSHCEDFGKSLECMCQETESWGETATSKITCVADQQCAFLSSQKEHLQSIYKNLDDNCSASVAKITDHVGRQKDTQETVLKGLLDKMPNDKNVLMTQKEMLLEKSKHGLIRVNGFVGEELKVDIPTGTTPQRKDYRYPVTVVKSEPRDVLLGKLRQKQLELGAAEILDQNSLMEEEEIRETNESLACENFFFDTSLCIQTSNGVPFFQRKKNGKKDKENKLTVFLDKTKEEDATDTSFSKSKYTLRIQN